MGNQAIVPVEQPAPDTNEALQDAFARRVADLVAERAEAERRRLPAKAGVPVGVAVDAFVADLRVGKSACTASTYRAALRRFLATLPADATVAALTIEQALDFARGLTLSKVTLHTYTTAVSGFYAFLLREEYRPDLALPLLGQRMRAVRGKLTYRLPRVPTTGVVEAMATAATTRPARTNTRRELIRLRDIALLACLRSSGMRVAEVAGLRVGHLDPAQRGALVTGKGGRERVVLFDALAWAALQAYHAARAVAGAAAPVFASHWPAAAGQCLPLTTKGLRDAVRRLTVAAGQQGVGVTPHRYRAWYATHLYEGTGDLALVQDALGHVDPATTRRYVPVNGRRLREAHARVFDQDPAGTSAADD